MRSALALFIASLLAASSGHANAATLTFENGARTIQAAICNSGGLCCDNNSVMSPSLIPTTSSDSVGASCDQNSYTSGASSRLYMLGPGGLVVYGTASAAAIGNCVTASGGSRFDFSFALDDTATVRVRLLWATTHSTPAGWRVDKGLYHCSVCTQNLLSPINTTDASSGDHTILVPLFAGTGHVLTFGLSASAGSCAPPYPHSTAEGLYWVELSRVAFGTVGVEPVASRPHTVVLSRPYPNPAAAQVALDVLLPFEGRVTLDIVDVAGRRIRRASDAPRGVGKHVLEWDGKDDAGRDVAGGVYFAKVSLDGLPVGSRTLLRTR